MNIDFTQLKTLNIGGVEMQNLSINGIKVWEKPAPAPTYTWRKYNCKQDAGYTYGGSKRGTVPTTAYLCYYDNINQMRENTTVGTNLINWSSNKCKKWSVADPIPYRNPPDEDLMVFECNDDGVYRSESRQHSATTSKFVQFYSKSVSLFGATMGYNYYQLGTVFWAMGSDTGQTVSSTNANAYPVNGRHSDGYWYVKQ